MSRGERILVVEGLKRQFAEQEVIRHLDLIVHSGERVALLGPNGSGKSTVLRCVAGTLTPTLGSIKVGGRECGSLQARRLVGVSLSQERSFYLRLSGRQNLTFFARMRGLTPSGALHAVAELEEELQLGEFMDERADRYSTGMILQLGFARALLDEPALLLLDEPTRSLDTRAVERLWSAVDRRPESAVLIATHREEDVAHCDSTVELPC